MSAPQPIPKWLWIFPALWAISPWLFWFVYQFHKPDHADPFWLIRAASSAVLALGYLGGKALPPLIDAVRSDPREFDTIYRLLVVNSLLGLSGKGVDASSGVAALFLLQDSETRKREEAALRTAASVQSATPFYFTPELMRDWVRFVPALSNCLHHPNSDVRAEATYWVGRFSSARPRPLGPLGSASFTPLNDPIPNASY